MSPFQAFYDSPYQQPLLLEVAALAGLGYVVAKRRVSRSVRWFTVAFGLVPLLDAWLTADSVVGIGNLGSAAVGVATFFVVLGDFRLFLFLEAARPDGRIAIRALDLVRALCWSLVVPIATAIARGWLPEGPARARWTFLLYELGFLLLLGARRATARQRWSSWSRGVADYALAYYAAWALADAIILGLGSDLGYLIRVLPNVLYYGGLLAWTAALAPEPRD